MVVCELSLPHDVSRRVLDARKRQAMLLGQANFIATTTKLIYTLIYDNSMLPDDAARAADKERRRARFMQALQNMKTLAEGGKLN